VGRALDTRALSDAAPTTPDDAPPALEARGLHVRRDGRTLLGGIDLVVSTGAFLGVLGPNGSGKTTLLRSLTGALALSEGEVFIEGRPLASSDLSYVAQRIGIVPQTFTLDFKFTVREVVALGRYPHRRSWSGWDSGADETVDAALEALSITDLADRPVTEISGGERQRVLIAQTLAQDTPILMLDEPLNNLDLNHQLQVMQVLARLHSEGRTILVVVHDINMAAQYCADLVLLSNGRVAAEGTPERILTPEVILDVFSTRVAVHRQGGRPYVTPLGLSPRRAADGALEFRLHLITGGGAGADLARDLVHLGFTPSLGVVSVFDTDFEVARSLDLSVVSAPPFQPLTRDDVREHEALAREADCVVVAPQVYGAGNLANLEVAHAALKAGVEVVVVTGPPIGSRDLTEGRAAELERALLEGGAVAVPDAAGAVDHVCVLAKRAAARGAAAEARPASGPQPAPEPRPVPGSQSAPGPAPGSPRSRDEDGGT